MWNRFCRAAAKAGRITRVRLSMESLEQRDVPAAFTAGDLVIYRVGDGSAALTSAATAVFLDEYTPDGKLVQSIALPTTTKGLPESHKQLTASGTAVSEGFLTLSADGQYIVLAGYAADVGTTSLTSKNGSSINRVVGRVDASGNIDTTTALSDVAISGNVRGAASTDGNDIWLSGASGGVRYTTLGSTTSTDLTSKTLNNARAVAIFDGQLYASASTAVAAGTYMGVTTIGDGLPTTSGQSVTVLSGLGESTNPSDFAFFFADLSEKIDGLDTLYIADESATIGGILKFTFDGKNWNSNGVFTPKSDAYRGITGVVNDGVATLYVTSSSGLFSFTDKAGFGGDIAGEASTIATPGKNMAFRGVAFAPGAASGPSVTEGTQTLEDTFTETITVLPNDNDGGKTELYQITNIQNGTVYRSDRSSVINDGDLISRDEGKEGLYFLPNPDLNGNNTGTFSFDVQAYDGNKEPFGGIATATITVTAVNDEPSFDVAGDVTVAEDSGAFSKSAFASKFSAGPETATDESGQSSTYSLSNDNTGLFSSQPAIDANGKLTFTPAKDKFGKATVTVTVNDGGGTDNGGDATFERTFTITVSPVADTPSVTNSTTNEDIQTANGDLVISRNAADGTEVTHFIITNIQHGTLYQNDGSTKINSGDFITYTVGHAGLRFTPAADYFGSASFDVQGATDSSGSGLSSATTATITVNAVADTPSVTGASTPANVQSTSGLVVSRNTADNAEVGFFKITSIAHGTLYQHDGSTKIESGDFITFAQANAGLRFSPDTDFVGTGSFVVQASLTNGASGLGGETATASITVTPKLTPSVSTATTDEDSENTSGLAITVNPADGGKTAYFQITNIVGGTLYYHESSTQIIAGDFITVADGGAGLTFLPNENQNDGTTVSYFGFDVQASQSNDESGLGGSVVTATITVNPVNDEPTFDLTTTTVTVDEDSAAFGQSDFATNIVRGPATATDENVQMLSFDTSNDNNLLFSAQPAVDANGKLTFTLAPNAYGSATVAVVLTDSGSNTALNVNNTSQQFTITVPPKADKPNTSNATTTEDTQTNGLVITPNAADGVEITHFKIISISNGRLFKSDGVGEVFVNDFITLAEGSAGLKFTPDTDLNDATTGFFGFDVKASIGDTDAGLGTDAATVTVGVTPVDDKPTFDLPATALTLDEGGTFSQDGFATNIVRGPATATDESGQTLSFSLLTDNDALFSALPTIDSNGKLAFTPKANAFGTAHVTATLSDGGPSIPPNDNTSFRTFTITVNPLADTPSITNSTTNEDAQTSDGGLIVSRNSADGSEVGFFKITSIQHGTLYQHDGSTKINSGDFISYTQAHDGLKFTPADDYFGSATFDVQASLTNDDSGLGGAVVTATIAVNAVADTPSITSTTTDEDKQSTSGLVISRNVGDSGEVGFFKITNIIGGALFQHNGTTPIISGDFITYAQAHDGLTFTPSTNLNSALVTFGFNVQASTSNTDLGLGGSTVTATITVNAVNDKPSFTVPIPPVVVNQDSGGFVQTGFAIFNTGGGTDEATQAPTYKLTNNNNLLFSNQPAVDSTGKLTFTLAAGKSGTALVTVNATDSGASGAPNDNAATPKQFTITVNAAPVVFAPPSGAPPITVSASTQYIAVGSDSGTQARVRVLDARTNQVVRDFFPYGGFTGGVRVAVGDVTGDGTDDIVTVSASGVAHVKVFNGANGAEVTSLMPLSSVASGLHVATGDVDGDGRADIVVGLETGGTTVMVISGRTFQTIRTFEAFSGYTGGVRLGAGDVNGDGRADIAVVAGPGGNGHIKVFDGGSGELLTSYLAYPGYLGEINLALGDVTGDGRDEIITTALNPNVGTHVKAVTALGQQALSFFAPNAIGVGMGAARGSNAAVVANQAARVATADVTGDRIADILLGDPPGTGTSRLLVLNGRTPNGILSQFDFDPLGLGVFVG